MSNLRVCDRQCSPTSASFLTLFQGDSEKAFDVSVIEVDGATKMTTNGAVFGRILCRLLDKSGMVSHMPRGSPFLRERRLKVRFLHKCARMQYCGNTQSI